MSTDPEAQDHTPEEEPVDRSGGVNVGDSADVGGNVAGRDVIGHGTFPAPLRLNIVGIVALLTIIAITSIIVVSIASYTRPLQPTATVLSANVTLPPTEISPTNTFPPSEAGPVQIAILNIKSTVQADGTIKNTAQLSIEPLGLGALELSAPARIELGHSRIVRLLITPDSALLDLPQVATPLLSANDPDYALKFSDEIQIYPIMIAELSGVNFEIAPGTPQQKPVISLSPVEWIWSIRPHSPGRQSLVLTISIPVIIDQVRDTFSTQALKNIPIEVLVEVTATPPPAATPIPTIAPTATATPTPPSTLQKIGDSITENFSTILVACISLIGALATAYVTYVVAVKPRRAGGAKSRSKNEPGTRKKK